LTITPRLASCAPPTVAVRVLADPADPFDPDPELPDPELPDPELPDPELEPPDRELPVPELACPAPWPGAGECAGRGPARTMGPAGAALAGAAPAAAVAAATAAHRHAAAAPVSRCRRAAGRCALPKNSRMVNYVW
jgi:hypothetical protein